MNEAHFFIYFHYLFDMCNNAKEKILRNLLHPRSKTLFTDPKLTVDTKLNAMLFVNDDQNDFFFLMKLHPKRNVFVVKRGPRTQKE